MPQALLCGILLFSLASASTALASNPIQVENAKPGDPGWALVSEANGEIEGYASATSINRGESIDLYVNTNPASTYTLTVYRLGWYNGDGARRMLGPVTLSGIQQPMPTPDPTTGMIECNWTKSYTVTTVNDPNDPTVWCSGAYVAKIETPAGKGRYIFWVVRDDARHANHYFQSCVTTYEAYNNWGGKSLYDFNSTNGAARKVSFNRPFTDGSGTGDFLWRWEYNFIRFLEREGYDVQYCTNIDTARRGSLLLNHKDFLSGGHDEYWSDAMRTNVVAARDAGVNLGFFSANDCYWQIRLETSPITGAADRTIVGYKEVALTQDPYATDSDKTNDRYITTNWRNSPVSQPEAAFIGVQYVYDPVDADIVISDVTTVPWVFTNTGLTAGSHIAGLLGYEVDAVAASSPAGKHVIAHSPFTNTKVTPNQTQYSDMTVYTAASGAIVFATGSIQWAWGVDDWNAGTRGSRLNPAAQQMTRNILEKFAGASAANDCQYTLSSSSAVVSATAGSGSLTLTAGTDCAWTIGSSAGWLNVTSATSGSGSTTINYTYTQNSGAERTATLTIGDKSFVVTQEPCSYAFSPSSLSAPVSGTSGTLTLTADGGCGWTASSDAPWLRVTSGGSGTGSGAIGYVVDPNPSPARTGHITAGNATFTVTQPDGCTFSLSPTSASYTSAGGSSSFSLTASWSTCTWSAGASAPWITTNATSGSGSATIGYTVSANPGNTRNGTITAGGQTFSIAQASGCTYTVDRTSFSFPQSGGNGSVTLTTDATCFWSVSADSFITITSATEGSGSTVVTFTVGANNGADRSGLLIAGGNRVTISQAGVPCTYSVSPSSFTVSGRGGLLSASLSAPAGCGWSNSNGAFTTITSPMSGSGSATVTFNVAPNPGTTTRTDHIAIAGVAVTITQNPPAKTTTRVDSDGDGRTDVSIFRPIAGNWYFRRSSDGGTTFVGNFGPQQGDVPVPGDYDGDGRVDVAIFRPIAGNWYILHSSNNQTMVVGNFGPMQGDQPVAADYDGDGKTDIAIFRPGAGNWYIRQSSNGQVMFVGNFGPGPNDIPVPADYDGDGKADIAIFRPGTGEWFIRQSSNGQMLYVPNFGPQQGDVPVPADYDGDGKADIAIFRPMAGNWYIRQSSNLQTAFIGNFGPQQGDKPVPGDYDGDGKADIAIFRPIAGNWYVRQSSNAQVMFVGNYGPQSNDMPLPAYAH
jgi:FG-GAP-like repeat/Viral BACON domain/Putative binding domain, N-terminal